MRFKEVDDTALSPLSPRLNSIPALLRESAASNFARSIPGVSSTALSPSVLATAAEHLRYHPCQEACVRCRSRNIRLNANTIEPSLSRNFSHGRRYPGFPRNTPTCGVVREGRPGDFAGSYAERIDTGFGSRRFRRSVASMICFSLSECGPCSKSNA